MYCYELHFKEVRPENQIFLSLLFFRKHMKLARKRTSEMRKTVPLALDVEPWQTVTLQALPFLYHCVF